MYEAAMIYLFMVNVLEIYLMYADKHKAINGLWRISEKKLLLVSAMGGSPGGIFGMYTFRHKIKKTKFVIGMPLILLLQISIVIFIVYAIT